MIAQAGVINSTGSQMTFDDIYQENADMILNLAYRMTGKQEVARDLTQDIFVKVYEKSDSFREQSKISTWIYRIAMNHILNFIKREKRLSFLDFMEQDTKTVREGTVTVWEQNLPTQPDKALEDHEKENIIRHFVEQLNAKYKIPFLLFRYEEMSYQQIANQLGLSMSAVESRIFRAKKKLAEKLKPWQHRL
ncbi:MAG: sigma-70 family RNA polymerase sigma factor [Calditrichaeota bacterium]|nr:MAG: sigma-70 family RNA polymerase sigma factor [Calditrichota bacterium]MBL1207420.1 sigma-70 family RNA polymerase sigma factor [Calditrichota bacterium]NOG47252.1 sigma-70 family RNA polymerase sigma factor [Calditrichota bacterium]